METMNLQDMKNLEKSLNYLDKTEKDYWNRTSFNFDQWKYLKRGREKKN